MLLFHIERKVIMSCFKKLFQRLLGGTKEIHQETHAGIL
jgi:hypothetical protein